MKGAFFVGVISSGETAPNAAEAASRKAQRVRIGRGVLTLAFAFAFANAKPLQGAGF
jgi:hypothetical protein